MLDNSGRGRTCRRIFGIGRVLVIAGQDIYPGMILVAMLCVAALGAGMTKVLTVIEQRLLAWRFA
ncbi:hypothetical protein ACFSYD_23830 [Paracoccus aerius]